MKLKAAGKAKGVLRISASVFSEVLIRKMTG